MSGHESDPSGNRKNVGKESDIVGYDEQLQILKVLPFFPNATKKLILRHRP